MSKYSTIKIDWKSLADIKAALKRLNMPFQDHSEKPISIQDFFGTTAPVKASLLVKKGDVLGLPGLTDRERSHHYCDLAIFEERDGTFSAVIDETHGRSAASVLLEKMRQHYTAVATKGILEARGWGEVSCDVDEATGDLVLEFNQ